MSSDKSRNIYVNNLNTSAQRYEKKSKQSHFGPQNFHKNETLSYSYIVQALFRIFPPYCYFVKYFYSDLAINSA
jgi:hypothetical protein